MNIIVKIILFILAALFLFGVLVDTALNRIQETNEQRRDCDGVLVKRYDDRLVCVDYER